MQVVAEPTEGQKSLPVLRSPLNAVRRALPAVAPRERWTPSEWAEHCRVLSEHESSEPGRYSFDRTPYWRQVCDAAADPFVEEIVCLKGAQIGWSECCRNVFGYWVDLDPGPTMVLMPDQKSAEDFKDERIDPLIKNTEAVRRHLTSRAWDDTKHRIRFDTMSVYFVWAGSKSGTKSRPIKNLICEEPDEYPPFSSTGGDPLSKAEKRLTTYRDKGRAKILLGGTPTTRTGNAFKRWEMCAVRYHYWVPCPYCNGFQQLLWKQVKYPAAEGSEGRAQHAERVKAVGLAYYACEHCQERIDDHHKPRMLRRGVWAQEDQAVTIDGRVVGERRQAKRVGYRISSLYSPWVLFGQLAAEWIEAQGDPNALADFVNQRLAEPFEEQRAKTEASIFQIKAKGSPAPGIVPAWAMALVATADTQGNNEQDGYFWYTIRAWGYSYRSQLVDFGVANSKGQLEQRTLQRAFPMEGVGKDGKPGGAYQANGLWVDSGGHRWSEIYQWAQGNDLIHPVKGASVRRTWMVDERPQKKHGVVLWEIDTEQSKDLLHRLIHDADRTLWLPHSQINDDYCRQMSSEAKVFNARERREEWIEIDKKNNHLWDCYDASMEVLTSEGWKLFSSLTGDELLATLNMETEVIEMQRPTALIAKSYKGPMIHFGGQPGQRLDLLVTPSHRMVVYEKRFHGKSKGFSYPLVIKPAKEVGIWDCIKLNGKWIGDGKDTFKVPAMARKPAVEVDAKVLAQLAGWYVAEGYCRRSNRRTQNNNLSESVVIYQNAGPKRETIRRILEKLPWSYSETDRGFIISSRQAYSLFCDLGDKYTKRVPEWIKKSSQAVIQAFIESAVDGDGWRDNRHEVYATVSKQLADDMQELYVKAGFSSNITIRDPKPYCIRGKSGTNTVKQYHVHRRLSAKSSLRDSKNKPNFKTVDYDGMVYCATVPNGTLVVRRNGKVAICGNCEQYQAAVAWRLGCGMPDPNAVDPVVIETNRGRVVQSAEGVGGGEGGGFVNNWRGRH